MLARLRGTCRRGTSHHGVCRPVALLIIALLFAAPVAQAQQAPSSEDVPTSGTTITYDEAVDLALRRNYRLRQAENNVNIESISVAQNRAEFYPNLSVSMNGRRNFGRGFNEQEGSIINQTSETANFGASSSLNLFNGFFDMATLEAAQARTQAASRSLRRSRQNVVFDVISLFIELAQNRALVDVREEQLALSEQQLAQTEAQIEVGEQAPSAIYQLQADVAAAEQQLLQAERNVDITKTELVRILVLDPFGNYTFDTGTVESASEGGLALTSYQLDPLLKNAYTHRNDLDAQQAFINAEEQNVRAARSGFWPSLNLSASYGSNWSSLSTRPIPGTGSDPRVVNVMPIEGGEPIPITVPGTGAAPQQTRPPFFDQLDARRGGGISLSLGYPLFDRFQTRYSVEQAQVQLENQRFQEEVLRQDIAVEVRQALLEYKNARTELDVTAERLEAAEQAQQAAQERYRLGAATYVELAVASADLADAQSARVRAEYGLLLQQKRLDYVTGTLNPDAPLTP